MFTWEGKRIITKLIPPVPKQAKEKSKFISICNRGEFLVESKETVKICFGVKEVTPYIEVPEKMKSMLENFKRVVQDESFRKDYHS